MENYICVCSNSLERLCEFRERNKTLFERFNVLICTDEIYSLNIANSDIGKGRNVSTVYSEDTSLNNFRNIGLSYLSKNNCEKVLFIDDDVVIPEHAVDICFKNLAYYVAVGCTLRLPKSYSLPYYITTNQLHYLAIHNEITIRNKRVWGACMGFNINDITKYGLTFRSELDLQEGKLIVGGDTSFIDELVTISSGDKLLCSENYVYHFFNKKKLTFSHIVSRIYYQGATEYIRNNIYGGLKKEIARNTYSLKKPTEIVMSVFYISVFIVGFCSYIVMHKKRIPR